MSIDFTKPLQTRDGRKVRLLRPAACEPYPAIVLYEDTKAVQAHTSEGQLLVGSNSPADLMNVPEEVTDNTPHGPAEYKECLKVVTGAIAGYFSRGRAELLELRKQRDAALKLADEILIHRVSPLVRDSEWVMGRMDGKRDVANKIRAIFEPKEQA